MTFVVHNDQGDEIELAIKKSVGVGAFDSDNDNRNGNALSRICETYNGIS